MVIVLGRASHAPDHGGIKDIPLPRCQWEAGHPIILVIEGTRRPISLITVTYRASHHTIVTMGRMSCHHQR